MPFFAKNKITILSLFALSLAGLLYKCCTKQERCEYKEWPVTVCSNVVLSSSKTEEAVIDSEVKNCPLGAKQISSDAITRAKMWAGVKSIIKDTVVQIIVHITPFNFLQPYKISDVSEFSGSAFFISSDGYLITNAHVVNQAKVVWLRVPSLGQQIVDASVICVSPERDLALVKVSKEGCQAIISKIGHIPYLELGSSDNMFRADKVMALGYPLGQTSLKSTTGVISGREHINNQHLIQMSAPINTGSSGGPVINMEGEVVGVSIGGIFASGAQNVGYIIPASELKIILPDMYQEDESKTKLLRRPFLGALYCNGSKELCEYLGNPYPGGLYVVESYKGGPLEMAGIKSGDMIYQVNGVDVDMYGDLIVSWSEDKIPLIDYISRLRLGQDVNVVLYRNGERKELDMKFEQTELLPVRMIYPSYEEVDYENFGGIITMSLALNHIPIFASLSPRLTKYTQTKNQTEAAVVVTYIIPNSQAHRTLSIGPSSIIEKINEQEVETLEDLRRIIRESLGCKKHLILQTTDGIKIALSLDKMVEETQHLSLLYRYPITPFAKECIDIMDRKKGVIQNVV